MTATLVVMAVAMGERGVGLGVSPLGPKTRTCHDGHIKRAAEFKTHLVLKASLYGRVEAGYGVGLVGR